MASSIPVRKVALPALALVALIAVWLAVRGDGNRPLVERDGSDAGARSAAEAFDRMKERLNSFSTASLPAPSGALEIRGTVLGPDGPIAGAVVTATQPIPGESLSTLECHCGNECKRRLLECGCPEAAAQLLELLAERRGEAPPVARTTADSSGHYALRGLGPGTYTLWADAKIGVAARDAVQAGDGAADIRVSPGRSVAGVVKGDDQRPIAGAVVTAIHARHGRFFDALTGPDGRFSIGPVPPGKLQIVASARDLLPSNEAVGDGEQDALSLVLHVPRRIRGHVSRAGQPVGDVRVALDGEHRKVEVRSDVGGAFAFERLGPGDYELSATDGADQASATAHVKVGKEPDPVQLSLEAGCSLSGHVQAEDGEPVAGAKVTVSIHSRASSAERVLTTDAAGDFSARGLPSGRAFADAGAPGFIGHREQAALAPAVPARLDFALKRALRIAGIVTGPDGQPISEVAVRAQAVIHTPEGEDGSDASGLTGPGGRFELAVSAPGDYELGASHEDYLTLHQKVRAPSAELALRLEPGLSLEGIVVDAAGAPVRGLRVTVEPRGRREADDYPYGLGERSATSGEDGRFTVRGLVPGSYLARASNDDGAAAADAEVPAPGPIRLQLKEGHAVRGKVVDSDGTPIERASVQAVLESWRPSEDGSQDWAEGRPAGQVTTGAGGAFSVRALRDGRYQVSASKLGYWQAKPLTARAGGDELTVVLQSNGMIRGRVVDEAGNAISRYHVDGYEVDDESGAFEVPIHANGTRTLHFDAGPDWAQTERTVELTVGKDASVGTVVLTSGVTVRGRVIDRDTRAPIAGALVDVGDPVPQDRFDSVKPRPEQGAVPTGADGAFELPHVDSSRPLAIFATHPDYPTLGQPLAKGESPTIALERGGAIEGRVLSSSGAPIECRVFALSSSYGRPRVANTDSTGHFRIAGVRPGDYRIGVDDEQETAALFLPVLVRVDSGKTAQVELRPRSGGATLRVKVATSEGEGFSFLVAGTMAIPTDPKLLRAVLLSGIPPSKKDGFEEFTSLAPGPYTVLYGADSHAGISLASLPLEMTSESRELSLEVPKDAVLIKPEVLAGAFGE